MERFVSEAQYYLRFSDLLQRLMRSLYAQVRHYSLRQKLSLSEYRVLFLLRSGKQIEMHTISDALSVTGAFATHIADRLVKHELVVRQRNNKDRRKVAIVLTDKGKHCLVKLEAYRKKFFKALVHDLEAKDRRIMENGISILVASLESIRRV